MASVKHSDSKTQWLYGGYNGQMGTDARVPRTQSPAARLFKPAACYNDDDDDDLAEDDDDEWLLNPSFKIISLPFIKSCTA